MKDLEASLREAVSSFWKIHARQSRKQGAKTGKKDAGARKDATGGAQLDGFTDLIRDLLVAGSLKRPGIYLGRSKIELPGWFRPEKKWDLLVISKEKLIAAIELKSHIGPSFGNNYNNRTEESIGNATDILAAYREGAFRDSLRPWLGYLMLLEDDEGSRRPVKVREPHYGVFEEFRGASYAKRYELTLKKLVRERLYDAACLITSSCDTGIEGDYNEPCDELSFRQFSESLLARAIAHSRTGG